MPNALAYLALFAWPLAVAALFSRLPLREALVWSVLAGYLLLPQATFVDLPLLPVYDKTLAPALAAAIMCLSAEARAPGIAARGWLPRSPLALALIAAFVLGPVVTAVLNAEPVHAGGGVFLRGLTLYDAFSAVLGRLVLLLPYLLARRYLGAPGSDVLILRAFCLAGLAYSLPMLFEVRMSPQLHTWIYGFFPHAFDQQIRGGGFRPVVFLGHGLWVAMFAAMCVLSTIALQRVVTGAEKGQTALAAVWLLGVLVLCKSLGALGVALALAPVVALSAPRAQLGVAACVAAVVLLYPMLRGAGLAPVQAIYDAAAAIDVERASSFLFRLDNEDALLARANEKPGFGWGGWGRSHIFDPLTGRSVSVTDGRWVIVIGESGWVGYIAEFGLLTLPIFLLLGRRGEASPAAAGLCVALAANLIDLIPNATLTPLTWLLAGAALGVAERRAEALSARPAAVDPAAAPRRERRAML